MKIECIQKGVKLLKEKNYYTQKAILNKLLHLGIKTNQTSFNQILKNKADKVSEALLHTTAEGIKQIVKLELGMEWTAPKYIPTLCQNSDWVPEIIHKYEEEEIHKGFKFHKEGRLNIHQKVAFMQDTQKEMIEFGLSLNSFSSYFTSRKESDYKIPIETLLQKGVNIKCYLLDPDSNAARLYFADRAIIDEPEKNRPELIREVIGRLKRLHEEIAVKNYAGSLELYAYKHIPYNYFFICDSSSRNNAKMLISHYIYGVHRSNSPVFEFTKRNNPILFKRYWQSYKAMTQDAKRIF